MSYANFATDLDEFESILQYALATCVVSNGKSCVLYPPPARDPETKMLVDGKHFCMTFVWVLREFQMSWGLLWPETPSPTEQSNGIRSALMDLLRVLDVVRKRIYQGPGILSPPLQSGSGHDSETQLSPARLEVCLPQNPETVPSVILTNAQQAIWDLLDGCAMTAKEIAQAVQGDITESAVTKRIEKLNACGHTIKNQRGRGYYRPDAPPDASPDSVGIRSESD